MQKLWDKVKSKIPKYTLQVIFIIIGIVIFIGINLNTSRLERSLELADVQALGVVTDDLHSYKYLSENTIEDIIFCMKEASTKYEIPIGLLHAIFRIESDYKFWSTHKDIMIKANGTLTKTNAIGMGGVVWEFWSDSLQTNNIVNSKSDLYFPINNINATAYILRSIIDKKLNSNTANENNIIAKIIESYYGEYNKNYHNKMIQVTSDIWLKRISRVIMKSNDNKRDTRTN